GCRRRFSGKALWTMVSCSVPAKLSVRYYLRNCAGQSSRLCIRRITVQALSFGRMCAISRRSATRALITFRRAMFWIIFQSWSRHFGPSIVSYAPAAFSFFLSRSTICCLVTNGFRFPSILQLPATIGRIGQRCPWYDSAGGHSASFCSRLDSNPKKFSSLSRSRALDVHGGCAVGDERLYSVSPLPCQPSTFSN